jgi:hypothetical protein
VDLRLSEEEFLRMAPACLSLLLRRLEAGDRKLRLVGARVEATLTNIHRGKESWEAHPASLTAIDLYPDLEHPADRRQRLQAEYEAAPLEEVANSAAFRAWKESFVGMGKRPPSAIGPQPSAQPPASANAARGN